MQSHSWGSIVELGARQLKSIHTYIEAAEGVEMAALIIHLLLRVFHQLCANCEKMTLGKQTRKKPHCDTVQINKLFSDFLFFLSDCLSPLFLHVTPSGRAFGAHELT